MSTYQFRKGSSGAWTSANPVLASGEPGFETNTGKFKIGDGVTAWNSLSYFNPGAGTSSWGGITGTLSNQTDLQSALDAKANASALSGYQPLDTQLTDLAGLSYTGNSLKAVRVNAGETGLELATISASMPDVVLSKLTQSADYTITSGYSAYVSDFYEIGSGYALEIASDAVMEIG